MSGARSMVLSTLASRPLLSMGGLCCPTAELYPKLTPSAKMPKSETSQRDHFMAASFGDRCATPILGRCTCLHNMHWRHFCDDTPRRCLRHVDDPAGHRDSSAGRGATDLAVQQRLGLLPERRTGSGPPDPAHPGADGPRVASPGLGGHVGAHALNAKSRRAPGPPARD